MLLLSDSCDINKIVPDCLEAMAMKYECFENKDHCSESPHEQLGNLDQDIVAAYDHSTWVYMRSYFTRLDRSVACYICKAGLDTLNKFSLVRSLGSKVYIIETKIANSVLLSIFMTSYEMCKTGHAPSTG